MRTVPREAATAAPETGSRDGYLDRRTSQSVPQKCVLQKNEEWFVMNGMPPPPHPLLDV